VDLSIHSPIRLQGVVLNSLSTGATLPFLHLPPEEAYATSDISFLLLKLQALKKSSLLTTDMIIFLQRLVRRCRTYFIKSGSDKTPAHKTVSFRESISHKI
jgi:hypothetical protein